MTHDEARLLIGAAPAETGAPLGEHLARCADCTLFQQQMQRMDRDLKCLLSAPLPPRADTRVLPLPVGRRLRAPRAQHSPSLLALAASLVLCVALGGLFWALRPQPSLAAGVIGHIEHESGSWSAVAPMTAAATDAALAGAGVTLDPADMTVTYARICLFDGHWVPHLVVRTSSGPVTVMVLPKEHIPGRQAFRQNGYSGVLVPAPSGGTLALVAPGDADVDAVIRAVDPHLHWTPNPVPPLTLIFLLAVVAGTATRLWLASRQIAAVTQHRDQVPEPFAHSISAQEHHKAADYTVARTRLGRIDTLLDAVVLLALTVGGGINGIDLLWQRAGLSEPWHGALVILSVLLVVSVIGLPLSLWSTFRVEARFGFNRSSLALFFVDRLKGLVLGLLIGGPLLLAALELMGHTGTLWWLYVWALWILVSLLMTWAWPALIAPLFNRFSPLSDATLRARIETLLQRCGFASRGVFVIDGSRRSAHGNAYFTGVGRNKRIVFFDTLISTLEPGEIEAVLAHELGHFKLHHVRRRLVLSAVVSLAGLALLGWLAARSWFYQGLGLPGASHYGALLLLMFVAPAFTFFVTPLTARWSRLDEFAADAFAAQHTPAAALMAALVKLYRDNATTLTPDRLHSRFYDSHPPALARIARLRELAPTLPHAS